MKIHDDNRIGAIEVMLAAGWLAMMVATAIGIVVSACGATAPTIVRGTLGGMYAACQTVDSDDATWRRICDGVERSLPALDQLGAGPADLPADVASREVTITIADGQ